MENSLRDIVNLMSKPDAWEIASVIAGIAGTIIAVVAIFMNVASIKAQNKQSLFEKRLENYLLLKTFYELIEQNLEHLNFKKETDCPIAINLEFLWITNASYFGESPKIIYDVKDEDLRRDFLEKIEELNLIAEKIALLFLDKKGELASNFVKEYSKTLRSMYGYQSVLDMMENDMFNNELKKMCSEAQKIGIAPSEIPKSAKQLCKEYGEDRFREDLINNVGGLISAYEIMKNDKILDSIKKELIL